MTPEEQFFKHLLVDVKIAFHKSPVFREQKSNEQWNFSICGTPIQRRKGILLGINWGGGDNYGAQEKMPEPGKVDILKYNFIQRSKPFLEKCLSLNFETFNFNYTNLCFFRTPKESFLKDEDYKNSLPLFEQYVDFIKPEWIFSLGNKNDKILSRFGFLKDDHPMYDSEQKYKAVVGKLWGYNFYSVPHPNARVKTKSRQEIWEHVGKHRSELNHDALCTKLKN